MVRHSPARPIVLAHRGLATHATENTAAAFRAAHDVLASGIETDAHASADGSAVLWHDPDLRRFDGSHDRIAELDWAALAQRIAPDGSRLQRLTDALAEFPHMHFNIDIKVDAALGPVVRAIETAQAHGRVRIASFSDARRRRAALALPRVATSPGMRAIALCLLTQWLPRLIRVRIWRSAFAGADALQVPLRYWGMPVFSRRILRLAHELGVDVHVWTVNSPRMMQRLALLGVDGIVTDRADLARALPEFSTSEYSL